MMKKENGVMKRRIGVPVAGILIICIVLTGCGSNVDSTESNVAMPADEAPAAYADDTSGTMADFYAEQLEKQENETWAKAPNDAEFEESIIDEEVITAFYPLTGIRPFSEGRAWVNFENNGMTCTGIIDTTGKLLYQADNSYWYVSQFADGLTYYRENETENSPCGIIDSNGNVLFMSQIETDGGYLILGYGNGHFLVAQHIQNFDMDEWQYGTVDENGNVLNEMKADDCAKPDHVDWTIPSSGIEYIGENFIQLYYGLYNISDAQFSLFPKIDKWSFLPEVVAGEFSKGYTILVTQYFNSSNAIVIDANYYRGGLTEPQGIYSQSHNSVEEGTEYSEGVIWGNEGDIPGYYDKDWNLIISMEQYKDNNIIGGAFRGGYAAVTMTGADGALYASVIKDDGNLVYSPIKIDSANPNNAGNGYFQVTIDGDEKIIGPNGMIYTPGVDDLSAIGDVSFGDISEKFMMLGNTYISLDGKIFIDSVQVVSGNTDTMKSENVDITNENSISYIIPNDYSIEGTWKSTGESGFGQAQPGAVVAFDGIHCNFFSPNDTYVFYSTENGYALDVTSILGDSMSFTVKIMDDDKIDIYYDSSITRLERVH